MISECCTNKYNKKQRDEPRSSILYMIKTHHEIGRIHVNILHAFLVQYAHFQSS
jgi:hypothetical protein